jgi:ABC-type transport system involved in cytochrome c biogenesis ATPase subunit
MLSLALILGLAAAILAAAHAERPYRRIGVPMRLDIVRVSKTFRGKVRALEEVSLTVPGGILGLLGANGAGKTTLMRLLTGLIRPNSGGITIGDHDMATADGRLAVQRVLGYLPQDLGVYPDLTARQFLDYVALLKGLNDRPYRRRRVGELLDLVNIADAADRKLRGYSGGMRRRVGIAQALLNDPHRSHPRRRLRSAGPTAQPHRCRVGRIPLKSPSSGSGGPGQADTNSGATALRVVQPGRATPAAVAGGSGVLGMSWWGTWLV